MTSRLDSFDQNLLRTQNKIHKRKLQLLELESRIVNICSRLDLLENKYQLLTTKGHVTTKPNHKISLRAPNIFKRHNSTKINK